MDYTFNGITRISDLEDINTDDEVLILDHNRI